MTTLPSSLRDGANQKIRRGFELGDELRRRMYIGWWEKHPVSMRLELRDQSTIELVMLVDPLPKIADWWAHASDVFQNFRSALDRFHYGVCEYYAPTGWAARVYFPITKDSKAWAEWTKQHPMLPREIALRYLAFQPWHSGRSHLADLSRINNLEKHSKGVAATVSLTGLKMTGTWKVEGRWSDDNLANLVKLSPGTLDITSERQIVGTIALPTRVVDIGDLTALPEFAFTPLIELDGNEIPILESIEKISREVTWAIAYISGLVASATSPPVSVNL